MCISAAFTEHASSHCYIYTYIACCDIIMQMPKNVVHFINKTVFLYNCLWQKIIALCLFNNQITCMCKICFCYPTFIAPTQCLSCTFAMCGKPCGVMLKRSLDIWVMPKRRKCHCNTMKRRKYYSYIYCW